VVHYAAVHDGFGGEIGVAHYCNHEVVGYAGTELLAFWKKMSCRRSSRDAILVSLQYQGVGFASSLLLHSMKSTMSECRFEDDHLAARRVLPPDLITPAKASKPFNEA